MKISLTILNLSLNMHVLDDLGIISMTEGL